MTNLRLSNSLFRQSSPPRLAVPEKAMSSRTIDTFQASANAPKGSFTPKVGALAALALSLATQASSAEVPAELVHQTELSEEADLVVDQSEASPDDLLEDVVTNVVDFVEDLAEKGEEVVEGWGERMDPWGVLEKHTAELGEYQFDFQIADFKVRPKWKDGLALESKGRFFETHIAKTEDLGNGWTQTQGLQGGIRGRLSTHREPSLDLEAGIFRAYEGPVGEDFRGRFHFQVSGRNRFLGSDDGFRFGVSARQEIEGGEFEVFGQDYQLYAEGRQSLIHNFETGDTNFRYKFMAGPKKDITVNILGQELEVSALVGPEVSGNTRGEMLKFGLGSKFRVRF